jgi:hypothetical protein
MSDDIQNIETLGNAALEAITNYYAALIKLYPERAETILLVQNTTGQMLCYAPTWESGDQLMRIIKQTKDPAPQ